MTKEISIRNKRIIKKMVNRPLCAEVKQVFITPRPLNGNNSRYTITFILETTVSGCSFEFATFNYVDFNEKAHFMKLKDRVFENFHLEQYIDSGEIHTSDLIGQKVWVKVSLKESKREIYLRLEELAPYNDEEGFPYGF